MVVSSDDLLALVLADPGDDGLRRVYADRLCELGDPRGELIHLQYERLAGRQSGEATRRERELLERHGLDWLGPIAAVVDPGFEIERGFLRACTVAEHRRPYNIERVAGHPLWATVEALTAQPAIYLHPVMRSLRRLRLYMSRKPSDIPELCTGPVERAIAALDVDYLYPGSAELGPITSASALPRLVELGFRTNGIAVLQFVLASPIAPRLERIVVAATGDELEPPLGEWLRELAARPHVPEVVIDAGPWYPHKRYTLRHGSEVRLELNLVSDMYVESNTYVLQRVAAQLETAVGYATRLEVVVHGVPEGPAFATLSRAVERFPGGTLTVTIP